MDIGDIESQLTLCVHKTRNIIREYKQWEERAYDIRTRISMKLKKCRKVDSFYELYGFAVEGVINKVKATRRGCKSENNKGHYRRATYFLDEPLLHDE